MGESIPALGWVMVEKTPAPHVNDMWQCGEFNQQKIIMAYKGKDETQVSLFIAPEGGMSQKGETQWIYFYFGPAVEGHARAHPKQSPT
eukprot:scaffold10868_cov121-Isochrysis_galbana.AAC.1